MNRDLHDFLNVLGFDAVPSLHEPVASHTQDIALMNWDELAACVKDCKKCKLSLTRTQTVFGAGLERCDLMFVGEGPGAEEEMRGLPFVGAAGELLTKMIGAMGLGRDQVFISNVVKCRPPNNRNPEPDEVTSCSPYLAEQIFRVQPKIIVALGTFAAQTLLQTEQSITHIRGKFLPLKLGVQGASAIKVMPTFHPAYLLRNVDMKRPVWEDLQLVIKELHS